MENKPEKNVFENHKSSLGMDANVAVILTYVACIVVSFIPHLGMISWVPALVVYLVEKESDFVKFYALQALFAYVVTTILMLVMILSIILIPFVFVLAIVIVVFMILVMVAAYKYELKKLPLIGEKAYEIVFKKNK